MTGWRTPSGEPVFRRSPDKAWPLRRVDEATDNVVEIKPRRKGNG